MVQVPVGLLYTRKPGGWGVHLYTGARARTRRDHSHGQLVLKFGGEAPSTRRDHSHSQLVLKFGGSASGPGSSRIALHT